MRTLTAHPPTLEQLLMRHYGDELAARTNRTGRAGNDHRRPRAAAATEANLVVIIGVVVVVLVVARLAARR